VDCLLYIYAGSYCVKAQSSRPIRAPTGKKFVSTLSLNPAFNSFPHPARGHPLPSDGQEKRRRIFRRFSGNSRDWFCRTFIRKTRNVRLLFLLPGGEGQDEGGQNTISILLFAHPHKLKLELQLEFHAGCCCVRQCSEPEPSTRSTA